MAEGERQEERQKREEGKREKERKMEAEQVMCWNEMSLISLRHLNLVPS